MAQLSPLEVAALRLRNVAPDLFQQFIDQIEKAVEVATIAVTEAPPDQILVCQGRAQAYRYILRVLKECHIDRTKPAT